MSLHGLYLGSPSAESIFALHMERTYIGAVHKMINFHFYSWKLKKWEIFKKWKFLIWTYILMSLYGLSLRNPSTESVFILNMENRILELCVKLLILIYRMNWKIDKSLKKYEFSYMDLRLLCFYTAYISVTPQ